MCVNQKCMSVSSLRKQGPSCPQDCNGNGWCNSKGHCHCKNGFAPPHCDYPGSGGSLDSGPASDPNGKLNINYFGFTMNNVRNCQLLGVNLNTGIPLPIEKILINLIVY